MRSDNSRSRPLHFLFLTLAAEALAHHGNPGQMPVAAEHPKARSRHFSAPGAMQPERQPLPTVSAYNPECRS